MFQVSVLFIGSKRKKPLPVFSSALLFKQKDFLNNLHTSSYYCAVENVC